MKQNQKCNACGGKLISVSDDLMQCENCKKLYYKSVDRTKKVRIQMPLTGIVKMLLVCLGCVILVTGCFLLLGGDKNVVSKMVEEAADNNRFGNQLSDVFCEFATKALGCSKTDLKKKDLDAFQYLYVDYQQDYYIFRCSFDDYYAYDSKEEFEKTVQEIRVNRFDKTVYLSDVKYFCNLTRLEAYASTWCDYRLAKDNKIRSILCNGSPYVHEERRMFDMTNPDTLEEFQMVTCYGICSLEGIGKMKHLRELRINMDYQNRFIDLEEAKSVEILYLEDTNDVKDYSPIGSLVNLRKLSIAFMSPRDITFLQKLNYLEELSLGYCTFDKAALEMILQMPNLKQVRIAMGGTANISWDELKELQSRYADKLVIEE